MTARRAKAMTIIDVMSHAKLFAPWFRDPATWGVWCIFLMGLFGLPLSGDQLATWKACTGRNSAPAKPFNEAWLVVGRRGGKSLVLALIAVFLACFRSWTEHLAPGERGTILVLAADRKQARTIMRYVAGMLEGVAALAAMIERTTAEEIELNNRITIEISTASFRTVRGYTLIAALCDEVAFWRTDEGGANPDTQILDALRPAMSTVPGAVLLCASSPYSKRGAMWEAYRRWYGKDGAPVLVWQADTRTMNPTVPEEVVAEAYERDAAAAAAEFGAQFRSDLGTYIDRALIEATIEAGRITRPPIDGVRYKAFVDASGGAHDSFTAAIAHAEGTKVILDALYERRAPFNPSDAVPEVVALLRSYRVGSATGDRYAAGWTTGAFRGLGIEYYPSIRDRSQIYADALPLFTSGRAELLDNPRLVGQLAGLERRTGAGRDRIDHPVGGRDDLANAAAGALVLAADQPAAHRFALPIIVTRDTWQDHLATGSYGYA